LGRGGPSRGAARFARLGGCASWVFAAMLAGPSLLQAAPLPDVPRLSREMSGGESVYEVRAGDSIALIGARHGQSPRLIARENAIGTGKPLKPGLSLSIANRHLAAEPVEQGIVINVPQRMLFLYVNGRLDGAWPVAAGRPDWPTPLGAFKVANKQRDKTWIVPKSIQQEMLREGKPVLTSVPPGPDNPLGRHWIGLSLDSLGIHGTIAPASIYDLRSHGCVRMHPDDVAQLFERVQVGAPGTIVYRPALLGLMPDGRIFAEVHRDAYRRAPAPLVVLREIADREGLSDRIDWGRVAALAREQDGIAREVGLPPGPAGNPDR
jgi:L,D-transpeptidase ErfK/SrfK